mmetsp:Transcript_8373/g.18654  ORF Transcript_8373/g.18654 Transcript_8373/m.18654 type:complete len:486 (+) Transcript_8373:121-1578(+)|eukprot:CAMPEP_0206489684 /NCGR_PEP_ID=MMETSP0324_2-20121206/43463_1 /ASSEMBLY_ACC=CAM_ASM_000836 /TAXON_ID=2866 /ORGANISM="Crypthecodinium cohnii, Strain Seligo" /LENGTH=485 /DNA_ID=CAMNT_0053969563 /DNA_START=30 /DNA_END=1487 /DNA_ORIENTATION=+
MGVLKDEFYKQVWLTVNGIPTPWASFAQLNQPMVRAAWSDLQTNGQNEGMTRKKKMGMVLAERPDIFDIKTDDRPAGTPLLRLTKLAATLDPLEGIPSMEEMKMMEMKRGPIEEEGRPTEAADTAAADSTAASGPIVEVSPEAGASQAAVAAARALINSAKTTIEAAGNKGKVAAGPTTVQPPAKKSRMGFGAMGPIPPTADKVWTPLIAGVKRRDNLQEKEMCRAIYDAIENWKHREPEVLVTAIGYDYQVTKLRKEAPYRNERILDTINRHPDMFMIYKNPTGGYYVDLREGALLEIYEPEELLAKLELQALLPEKIEHPVTIKDKYQAFRVEAIHAIHKRGGTCAVAGLGQEPGVHRHKCTISKEAKMLDMLQLFPQNFSFTPDESKGGMMVTLENYNISDTIRLDAKIQSLMSVGGKGGGKGGSKGGSKGSSKGSRNYNNNSSNNNNNNSSSNKAPIRDRDRDRDRDRERGRSRGRSRGRR